MICFLFSFWITIFNRNKQCKRRNTLHSNMESQRMMLQRRKSVRRKIEYETLLVPSNRLNRMDFVMPLALNRRCPVLNLLLHMLYLEWIDLHYFCESCTIFLCIIMYHQWSPLEPLEVLVLHSIFHHYFDVHLSIKSQSDTQLCPLDPCRQLFGHQYLGQTFLNWHHVAKCMVVLVVLFHLKG